MANFQPTQYPLIIRVTDGYLWVSSPDYQVNLTERFDNVRSTAQIGELVAAAWKRIDELKRKSKSPEDLPSPSKNRDLFPQRSDRVMRISEVAQILGVSEQSVRRMTEGRKLIATRTSGGHLRFRESDINRFLLGQVEETKTLESPTPKIIRTSDSQTILAADEFDESEFKEAFPEGPEGNA